jgi:periplasmic divalent cation tolerance protein
MQVSVPSFFVIKLLVKAFLMLRAVGELRRASFCACRFLWVKINFTLVKNMNDYIVILVTAKDREEAEKISKKLIEERLIACTNIVSPVTSFFHWVGNLERTEECLLVMKSRRDLFAEVEGHVQRLHSYEVPEVLALPIVDGSKAYLDWMELVLKPKP